MFPHEKKLKDKQKENHRFLSLKQEVKEVRAKIKSGKISSNKAAALVTNIEKKYKNIIGG